MVETFYNAFMLFKNCVSFKKIILKRNVYVQSQKYVKPIKLVEYCSTITSFDLWMSKKTYNIFAFGDKFLKSWLATKKYHNEFVWGKSNYKTSFSNKLDFFSLFFLIILIFLFFWITRKMPQFNNIIIIDNWVVKTT